VRIQCAFTLSTPVGNRPMAGYTVPSPRIPAAPLRRLAAAALAAASVLGVVALAPAEAASAADSIGISGAPSKSGAVDGRTRFSYQAGPGQHIADEYLVANTGTQTQTMTVLATDAFNTDAGDWGLLDSDAAPKDSGAWVRFDGQPKKTLTLAAGQSAVVPFTVDVPANAKPGDHAGGIVLSAVSPEGQVLVDRRVATRLYVRVPGDIQAALTVSSMKAHYVYSWNPFDGEVVVDMTVQNTGNVALGGIATVGTKTWFGVGVARTEHPAFPELLPGNVRKLSVTLRGIPAFGYLEPYITLAPQISPDAIQPPSLTTTKRSTTAIAMPWLLLAVVVLIGGWVLVTRLLRRRDAHRAEAWMAYVKDEEWRRAAEEAAQHPVSVDGGDSGRSER
jgi:hypothetical protein